VIAEPGKSLEVPTSTARPSATFISYTHGQGKEGSGKDGQTPKDPQHSSASGDQRLNAEPATSLSSGSTSSTASLQPQHSRPQTTDRAPLADGAPKSTSNTPVPIITLNALDPNNQPITISTDPDPSDPSNILINGIPLRPDAATNDFWIPLTSTPTHLTIGDPQDPQTQLISIPHSLVGGLNSADEPLLQVGGIPVSAPPSGGEIRIGDQILRPSDPPLTLNNSTFSLQEAHGLVVSGPAVGGKQLGGVTVPVPAYVFSPPGPVSGSNSVVTARVSDAATHDDQRATENVIAATRVQAVLTLSGHQVTATRPRGHSDEIVVGAATLTVGGGDIMVGAEVLSLAPEGVVVRGGRVGGTGWVETVRVGSVIVGVEGGALATGKGAGGLGVNGGVGEGVAERILEGLGWGVGGEGGDGTATTTATASMSASRWINQTVASASDVLLFTGAAPGGDDGGEDGSRCALVVVFAVVMMFWGV